MWYAIVSSCLPDFCALHWHASTMFWHVAPTRAVARRFSPGQAETSEDVKNASAARHAVGKCDIRTCITLCTHEAVGKCVIWARGASVGRLTDAVQLLSKSRGSPGTLDVVAEEGGGWRVEGGGWRVEGGDCRGQRWCCRVAVAGVRGKPCAPEVVVFNTFNC